MASNVESVAMTASCKVGLTSHVYIPLRHSLKNTSKPYSRECIKWSSQLWTRHFCRYKIASDRTKVYQLQPLFDALNVRSDHDVIQAHPVNVCYVNAVFGGSPGPVQDVVNRISHHLMPPQKQSCPEKQFTMINRRGSRQIINIHQLQQLATAAGWNTTVVYLEDYNIRQQFNIIRCSKVIFGVQGQGLIWSWFLNNDSSVVEVFWDNWLPLYGQHTAQHGLYTYLLKATVLDIDFDAYAKQIQRTKPFSVIEKMLLRSSPAKVAFKDNQYKFANVTVSPESFKYMMALIKQGYNRTELQRGVFIPEDPSEMFHS